jgi:hypothetical protein
LLFSVVFYLLASTCEILKGDAYLPFQLAEIELIINLKPPRHWGLTFPTTQLGPHRRGGQVPGCAMSPFDAVDGSCTGT